MKTISDRIVATLKTGVPALWGLALAWLIAHVPAVATAITFIDENLSEITLGVPIATVLELALTAAVIAGYYWLAARIADRFPAAGKWLLGSSLVPVYNPVAVIDPVTGDPSVLTRKEYQALIEKGE